MAKFIISFTLFVFSLCIYTHEARADYFDPKLNGIVLFELRNDWAFRSEKEKDEVNNLYTEIEPYLILSFNDRVALEVSLMINALKKPKQGDNMYFDNQALFVEELKLAYYGDNFSVFGGKYNPTFGTAWDLTGGVYGKDLAKDYELKERLGVGGSVFGDIKGMGFHTLTANSFFLDTTFLSESLITRRDQKGKEDGGVSNTEDLSSYSVTLDSEKFMGVKGLNTHLGHYNQAEGAEDTGKKNEKGVVIGANYTTYLTKDISAKFIGEYAQIKNSEGKSKDIDYLTGSVKLKLYKQWNAAVSYTDKDIHNAGSSNRNDHQFQVSGGYLFKNGFSVDVAYRTTDKDKKKTQGLGGLLAYTYEF